MWPSMGNDAYQQSCEEAMMMGPAFEQMKEITCIFHCCKCGKRIETWWEQNELEGLFVARCLMWSEVFQRNLPVVSDGVICQECIVFRGKGL